MAEHARDQGARRGPRTRTSTARAAAEAAEREQLERERVAAERAPPKPAADERAGASAADDGCGRRAAADAEAQRLACARVRRVQEEARGHPAAGCRCARGRRRRPARRPSSATLAAAPDGEGGRSRSGDAPLRRPAPGSATQRPSMSTLASIIRAPATAGGLFAKPRAAVADEGSCARRQRVAALIGTDARRLDAAGRRRARESQIWASGARRAEATQMTTRRKNSGEKPAPGLVL